MRAAGYHTAGIVSNLLLFRPAGYDRGFDDWVEIGPREEQTRTVDADMLPYLNARQQAGDRVNRAVADWLARRPSDRFFLYVHYMDVHDWTATGSSYDEAVGKVDRHLGELRRMLADAGLLEGSTVVITADHGEGLGEPHPLEPGPAHVGNPSYQSVLAVPLIVWPRVDADPDRLVRSDDTFRLIRRIAGLEEEPPPDLEDDELFLTEHRVQTYVRGSWKSTWLRGEEQPYLFDLAADPREERSVAAAHPDLVASHRRRIDALSRQLGGATTESGPSADDLERLRALGYVRTGDSGDGSPSE
jgi:arylsulfatase A-like enzyme